VVRGRQRTVRERRRLRSKQFERCGADGLGWNGKVKRLLAAKESAPPGADLLNLRPIRVALQAAETLDEGVDVVRPEIKSSAALGRVEDPGHESQAVRCIAEQQRQLSHLIGA
jgi:hypothetical protein